ncbi:carbamate kinase [Rhodopseudomonas julia]|uniref:Carbamate kinase n=1 Tax=Rhodopseudomonas julia TaxID=200617 RepID=A0ABU0C7C1_9BRAD|nr:carbamate kinase [Rhodopseudomonas julia]MDQ0326132.1 carbamate kinase [Rhodopseudomonas julia]
MTEGIPPRLLIAIGGNATHPEGIRGTPEEQFEVGARLATTLLPLMELNTELVLTHGNGPVAGKILMRNAIARDRVTPMSLDICGGHSQGGIGYVLMQSFENALRRAGIAREVVYMLTQVVVDADDPAFDNPTKPIGYFYDEEEAQALTREMGWEMREDSGRGWRHVVPSPEPRHIVETAMIGTAAAAGAVVIAGGGGGIPVVRDAEGDLHGVEAVIDKDRTSVLMANLLGIDDLMILTPVPRVAVDFGKPTQRPLKQVTLSEIRRHRADGQFPPGSMGPKIDAAITFLENGGKRVLIGRIEDALAMLRGEAGTSVTADDPA